MSEAISRPTPWTPTWLAHVPSPRSTTTLIALACLAVAGWLVVETRPRVVQLPWYEQMVTATERSRQAARFLGDARRQAGFAVDAVNDPQASGLIGPQRSPLTSLAGSLEAKLASTNPHFAGFLVDALSRLDVERGDTVAVAMSGSFPALNISTLSALDVLGLEPVVVSSVASSSWGAADPSMTWLDMERLLHEAGWLSTRSSAATIGGGDDIGRGLTPEGRTMARRAMTRNDIPFLAAAVPSQVYSEVPSEAVSEAPFSVDLQPTLAGNIAGRLEVYGRRGPAAAFINIGGGAASLGRLAKGTSWPGLVERQPPNDMGTLPGVASHFAAAGVPVIHLQGIRQLAEGLGLPEGATVAGIGPLYRPRQADRALAAAVLGLLMAIVGLLTWADRQRNRLGALPVAEAEAMRKDLMPEDLMAGASPLKEATGPLPMLVSTSSPPRLGRWFGLMATATLLGSMTFSSPVVGAETSAKELIPSVQRPVDVTVQDRSRVYFVLPTEEELRLRLEGPAEVEILHRSVLADGGEMAIYEMTYGLVSTSPQMTTRRFEVAGAENVLLGDPSLGTAARLRKSRLQVPAGRQVLTLRQRGEAGQPLLVRLRLQPPASEPSGATKTSSILSGQMDGRPVAEKASRRPDGPWQLRVGFDQAYDSNILRYADKYLDRFEAGQEPGRFRIDSVDDAVSEVEARVRYRGSGLGGRDMSAYLRLDHRAYARNEIKDRSRFELGWRQNLPGNMRLALTAHWLPDFYIRHQRDADSPALGYVGDERFREFSFERQGVEARVEKRWSKAWRSWLEMEASSYQYSEDFREFDSDDLRLGMRWDHTLSQRWRMTYRYRYLMSNAAGVDAPGETLATSDDNDASFDEHAVYLASRLRWRHPRGSWRTLNLALEVFQRDFNTDQLPSEAPLYAGRQDRRWRLSAAYTWPLRGGLDASAYAEWLQRTSRSDVSSFNLAEEKDFEVITVGLRLTYGKTWRRR